jgi:hypothetical protein
MPPITNLFRLRFVRDKTAIQWAAANPVLLNGEPGVETDTGFCKIGDGLTAWNALPYLTQLGVPGPHAGTHYFSGTDEVDIKQLDGFPTSSSPVRFLREDRTWSVPIAGGGSAPVNSDFVWVNQGGATVTSTDSGIYLEGPADSTISWHIRKKTKIPPYVITILFTPHFLDSGAGIQRICMLWRESGTGKMVQITVDTLNNFTTWSIDKWDSLTAYNSSYIGRHFLSPSNIIAVQMIDDLTNRIVKLGVNGENLIQLHSIDRTDFITADEVGFAIANDGATFKNSLTILSWVEQDKPFAQYDWPNPGRRNLIQDWIHHKT